MIQHIMITCGVRLLTFGFFLSVFELTYLESLHLQLYSGSLETEALAVITQFSLFLAFYSSTIFKCVDHSMMLPTSNPKSPYAE